MLPGESAIADLPIAAVAAWEAYGDLTSEVMVGDTQVGARIAAASREFITLATDTPANTPFLGTLQKSIRLDQSIVGSRGFGEISHSWAEFELINTERDYDGVVQTSAIDGRRCLFKMGYYTGRTVGAYADFATVADLTALRWHADAETLRVSLRDSSYKLDVPVQTSLYGGAGGLDGTGDLTGKRKPRAFGPLSNIRPVPVIPVELVYQINDGAINAVNAVYDMGAALTFDVDYATSVLLRAATVPAGKYATCLAEGLIRLGSLPAGEVTCDVDGDANGSYVSTTSGIIRRIVTSAADLTDPGDLDVTSFALVDVLQPAEICYYLDHESSETVAEAVRKLMGGIGGWAEFTRTGLMALRLFRAAGIAPVAYYNDYDCVSVTREPLPQSIDPPPRRWRVPYNRNWTKQTSIAASVTVDRASYLTNPYQIATTPEADATLILSDHPLSPDPDPIDAHYANEADAQTEADRLLALYRSSRALYRIVVKDVLFFHTVGETISLTYPRWDLVDGRMLRIVELIDDMDKNETEIVVFG